MIHSKKLQYVVAFYEIRKRREIGIDVNCRQSLGSGDANIYIGLSSKLNGRPKKMQ